MTDSQLARLCETIKEGFELLAATLVSESGRPLGETLSALVYQSDDADDDTDLADGNLPVESDVVTFPCGPPDLVPGSAMPMA